MIDELTPFCLSEQHPSLDLFKLAGKVWHPLQWPWLLVSPMQWMGLTRVTVGVCQLSWGDGANDVPMLQEAQVMAWTVWCLEFLFVLNEHVFQQFLWQVGVGISGKEGRLVALVADDKQLFLRSFCRADRWTAQASRELCRLCHLPIPARPSTKLTNMGQKTWHLLTAMSEYFNVIWVFPKIGVGPPNHPFQ